MDNEKRAILAIALSILVLLLYQNYFAPVPKRSTKPDLQKVKKSEQPVSGDTALSKVPGTKEQLKKADLVSAYKSSGDHKEKVITLSTKFYTAVFSDRGGCLKSFKLHRYRDSIETPPIVKFFKGLFSSSAQSEDQKRPQFKELIQSGQNQILPLRTVFTGIPDDSLHDEYYYPEGISPIVHSKNYDKSLTFEKKATDGIILQKKFLFSEDDYRIGFDFTIINQSNHTAEGNVFAELVTHRQQGKSSKSFLTRRGNTPAKFSYFINGKVEKIETKKLTEGKTIEGDITWASFEEKYFMTSIIPQKEAPHQVHVGPLNEKVLGFQLFYPSLSLKPGEKKTYHFSLYLGPKDLNLLEKQGFKLEKIIDFGMFDIIAKPLLLTLKFFYRYLGNYGIAIILLTIIIKIIFWPLTHKSFQSMKDMQRLQPEIAKLKEKYKDKKEELNREMMALYKKYKVNPLGGCLPMLLQIPVFFALYRVLLDSIELRHANFISFWINDLSAKDPTYISPIIMGVSMFVQQKMTPSSADPTQAKMMLFMPVVFTFLFLNFPSGLVIYWLFNNVLSIVQQIYINKQSYDSGGRECSQSKSKQKPLKKQSR